MSPEHFTHTQAEESGPEWEHEFGCGAAGKVGHSPDCCCDAIQRSEPQAGAQVPSQDKFTSETLTSALRTLAYETRRRLAAEGRLSKITAYATEAQKAPITREDMHDPLKALAVFDEREGLIRLILADGCGK